MSNPSPSPGVDLRELSVRRGEPGAALPAPPRHLLARYVLPLALLSGFVAVTAWAMRDAFLPRQPVTVVPVVLSRAEVRQEGTPLFKAAGWVEPRPTPIRVAALAPGVVEKLLVREDQFVEQGKPVALLVDEDAELALRRAKTALAARKAELKRLQAAAKAARTNLAEPLQLDSALARARAELARVETEIEELPSKIEAAQAKVAFARTDFQGKKRAGPAIAGRDLDRAKSAFDAAQADLQALRKRLEKLESERQALTARHTAVARRRKLLVDEKQAVADANAALDAARAAVDEARVAVDEAQLRFDRMTVDAPVSGRILRLVAHPGARLSASAGNGGAPAGEGPGDGGPPRDASTVVTMYEPDRLQVRVDVRFEDLPRVGRGAPARIESPALDEPLVGRVLFLTGFANIQKNTLEVKVSLDDPPSFLKPEMLVDVTFLAPKRPEDDQPEEDRELRIYVPRSLVETTESGSYVWVADLAAGVARRRSIRVGESSESVVEVTGGLDVASRLVSEGRDGLTDGQRIDVTGEDDQLDVDLAALAGRTSAESNDRKANP